tara:strand:+ start:995 stop:3220 length:2226 start_codon:yes stop_codon:yes gene_type:complete
MPNLVGIGNSQVPTNAMLGGMAYQDTNSVSIKSFDPGNISKIKTSLSADGQSPRGVFVYNTANDSDGGAWRHRCQDKSWENEPLATNHRGSRRKFPSLAVIVYIANEVVYIFDGDDPDCPFWMKIAIDNGGGTYADVHALNGTLVIGATNNGIIEIDFIADTIRFRNHAHLHTFVQGIYPVRLNRFSYDPHTEGPSSPVGDPTIDNEYINCVDMIVEPNAAIDPVTKIPIPTIGVATGNDNDSADDGGINIIRGLSPRGVQHHVIKRSAGGDYDIKNVKFTTCGNYYYWNTDYSPSDGHGNMLKWSPIDATGGLPTLYSYDQYGNNVGILASKYWAQVREDTAHEEVADLWGSYLGSGGSNTLFNKIVTMSNNRGAFGTNSNGGWTQWQLFRNPYYEFDANFCSNGILVNSVSTWMNTGWQPAGTQMQFIGPSTNQLGNESSIDYTTTISNGTQIRNLGGRYGDFTITSVGTLTGERVATGADLCAIKGFSSSNYLRRDSMDVNFGNNSTFQLTIMGWIKVTDKSGYQYLGMVYDSSSSAIAGIALYNSSGNAYMYDNTNSILNQEGQGGTLANGEWHHVCGVFDGVNGRRTLFVNGRRVANQTISNFGDFEDVSSFAVGHYWNGSLSYPCLGSLTLVKFVRGATTDEQIHKIWCDEKQMLKENAKCFMYFEGSGGSPGQCYGFDYDSSTDIIHVGNEDGRSDFRDLIRINNTTQGFPVKSGQYNSSHLAASGGLIVEDLA